MEQNPLVSVIINCYNGEKYLREAIDSVINQTYQNWEIIFWDNQSTDSTAEIVKSYNDERIHYFYASRHTTLGEARNLALDKITGVYVSFIDTDDIWDREFLNTAQKSLFTNTDCSGFYANYYMFNSSERIISHAKRNDGRSDFKYLMKHYDLGMSCSLVKTSVIKEHDIKFNLNYSLIEDYDFYLKVTKIAPLYYANKPLASYRMHEGSLTFKQKSGWAMEFRALHDDLINNILTSSEISLYSKEINWLNIRAVFAEMTEAIYENKRKDVLSLIIRNFFKSPKILIGLIYVLGGRSFYKTMYALIRNSKYHL